jgi:HTH-type transcriptional regulator / antitoxin HipB
MHIMHPETFIAKMPLKAYDGRMDYPIQAAGQLASQLRALRRARGLSQARLGAVLGVGQTRIARIEADPAAVSVGQLVELLNALGVRLVLRAEDGAARQPKRGDPGW